MRNHLFFLSTDKHASPFDINIGLDAGFDVVIPYINVVAEDAGDLTRDVIFSRGPKGCPHSGIFIGGSDVELSEEIMDICSKSIFEPFTVSIFADPRGAYTTAAAMVAKLKAGADTLEGKKVCVFGGTGPVGRIAAVHLANEKADVSIVTSRTAEAGREAAEKISKSYGIKLGSAAATSEEERLAIIESNDIAVASVKAGVQILSHDALKSVKTKTVIADVNATPPISFEGLDSGDDNKQITDNVTGVGALAIGVVKYKTQVEIYKAMLADKITVSYKEAYDIAKTLV